MFKTGDYTSVSFSINSQNTQNRRLTDEHKHKLPGNANRWITKHIFTCMVVLSTHTSYKCIHLSGSSDDSLTDSCRDKLKIHNRAGTAAADICCYNFPRLLLLFFFFFRKADFDLIFMSENIRILLKNMVTCLYIVNHPNMKLCFSWRLKLTRATPAQLYTFFILMYMTPAKGPRLRHRQHRPCSWVPSEALYAISVPQLKRKCCSASAIL